MDVFVDFGETMCFTKFYVSSAKTDSPVKYSLVWITSKHPSDVFYEKHVQHAIGRVVSEDDFKREIKAPRIWNNSSLVGPPRNESIPVFELSLNTRDGETSGECFGFAFGRYALVKLVGSVFGEGLSLRDLKFFGVVAIDRFGNRDLSQFL